MDLNKKGRNTQCVDLFKYGFSKREIADLYGVSAQRVSQIIGVISLSKDDKKIISMYQNGDYTVSEISKKMGLKAGYVKKVLAGTEKWKSTLSADKKEICECSTAFAPKRFFGELSPAEEYKNHFIDKQQKSPD